MQQMKNPNLFPNGKRFGFFLCGGRTATPDERVLENIAA
jgi:hypothetical protein